MVLMGFGLWTLTALVLYGFGSTSTQSVVLLQCTENYYLSCLLLPSCLGSANDITVFVNCPYKDIKNSLPGIFPVFSCERNQCVIEFFDGVLVLSQLFLNLCWHKGYCQRTESYLFIFSWKIKWHITRLKCYVEKVMICWNVWSRNDVSVCGQAPKWDLTFRR